MVGVVILLPLLGGKSPLPSWLPLSPLVGWEDLSPPLLVLWARPHPFPPGCLGRLPSCWFRVRELFPPPPHPYGLGGLPLSLSCLRSPLPFLLTPLLVFGPPACLGCLPYLVGRGPQAFASWPVSLLLFGWAVSLSPPLLIGGPPPSCWLRGVSPLSSPSWLGVSLPLFGWAFSPPFLVAPLLPCWMGNPSTPLLVLCPLPCWGSPPPWSFGPSPVRVWGEVPPHPLLQRLGGRSSLPFLLAVFPPSLFGWRVSTPFLACGLPLAFLVGRSPLSLLG